MASKSPPAKGEGGGSSKMSSEMIPGLVIGILLFIILFIWSIGCITALLPSFLGGGGGDGMECVVTGSIWIISAGGLLVHLVAWLFDFTVNSTIINAGSLLGGSGVMGAGIQASWTVVRDLVNLAFIAGLVWASFSMILNTSFGGPDPKKMVAGVVIGAVLVNFSYFFAGAIIDVSNFTATLIYQQALGAEVLPLDQIISGSAVGNSWERTGSISNYILAASGLAPLVYTQSDELQKAVADASISALNIFLVGFFGALLLVTFAYVLFQAAGLLVRRLIAIILLLILSPVAILSFVEVPVLKAWGNQWWKTLQAQALFPPLFFLLLALALKLSGETIGKITQSEFSITSLIIFDRVGSPSATSEVGGLLLHFVIVMGLVYAALSISKSVSQEIAAKLPNSQTIYEGYKGVMKNAAPAMMGISGGVAVATWATTNTAGRAINFGVRNIPLPGIRGNDFNTLGRRVRGMPRRLGEEWEAAWGRKRYDERRRLEMQLKENIIVKVDDALEEFKKDPSAEKRKKVEEAAKTLSEKEFAEYYAGLDDPDKRALERALPDERADAVISAHEAMSASKKNELKKRRVRREEETGNVGNDQKKSGPEETILEKAGEVVKEKHREGTNNGGLTEETTPGAPVGGEAAAEAQDTPPREPTLRDFRTQQDEDNEGPKNPEGERVKRMLARGEILARLRWLYGGDSNEK
jgi:hypothetical protein